MANLDTRSKRSSSILNRLPFRRSLPLPDGTISQGDRQHIAWAYSGILAATATQTGLQTATLVVQMYLSAAWVDVSADVMNSPYISWETGIQSDDPTALVAEVGKLEFWLDNSTGNSAGLLGYYSPGHANARTGFELGTRVRIKTTRLGSDRYQFHGRISEIIPEPGSKRGRKVHVTVTDYMEEMSARFVDLLTLQSNKTSDQLLTTLISGMDFAPIATSYDTGPDTFASAFHDILGEKQVVATVAQKIAQSDLSRIWVTGDTTGGETLVMINRQDDIGKTSQLTLTNTLTDLEVKRSRSTIANKIAVSFRPILEGTGVEVLYTVPDEISITSGRSYSFTALFRDPDGGSRLNGKDMITPVADTDYKMSSVSGSGNDLNGSLGISITFGSDRAEITLTNNHATATGYVWLFQLRGTALRLRDALEVAYTDATSVTAYGEKRLQYDTPYQNNINTTQSIADYLGTKWANPKNKISNIGFVGNVSSTLMNAAVNRDLGDMITLTETVTGISEDRVIIGRKVVVRSGIWRVEYNTKDSDSGDFWLLGTSGSSELGQTTTLGF